MENEHKKIGQPKRRANERLKHASYFMDKRQYGYFPVHVDDVFDQQHAEGILG